MPKKVPTVLHQRGDCSSNIEHPPQILRKQTEVSKQYFTDLARIPRGMASWRGDCSQVAGGLRGVLRQCELS